MWPPLPYTSILGDNDIYTLTVPMDELIMDDLLTYQEETGLDDKMISEFINCAVMSTNLPLHTREVLTNWSLQAWLMQKNVEGVDNTRLLRRLQINIFTAVTQMAPERMLMPQKYGYVILTMGFGRMTLISFPRYKYLDVVSVVQDLTAKGNMSIRGWKNVKLDRFDFVKSLHETMFASMPY